MADREVVEVVESSRGPVAMVRLTVDDCNLCCHRCKGFLGEGDVAEDRGDHWHCRSCVR